MWSKEFEDEFNIQQLFDCFSTELAEKWIINEHSLLEKKNQYPKFSEALKWLTSLSKPEIWNRLAYYYSTAECPTQINSILEKFNSL